MDVEVPSLLQRSQERLRRHSSTCLFVSLVHALRKKRCCDDASTWSVRMSHVIDAWCCRVIWMLFQVSLLHVSMRNCYMCEMCVTCFMWKRACTSIHSGRCALWQCATEKLRCAFSSTWVDHSNVLDVGMFDKNFSEWMSPSWVFISHDQEERMQAKQSQTDAGKHSQMWFLPPFLTGFWFFCSCLLQLKFVQVFLTYVFFFRHACLAMTSIVDSRAHFLKRCSDMGMADRAINHLVQGNVDNGKVAFSVGQPGHPLDNTEFNTFCTEHIRCLDQLGQYGLIETISLWRQYLGAWTIERARHWLQCSGVTQTASCGREHTMSQLKQRLNGVVMERQAWAIQWVAWSYDTAKGIQSTGCNSWKGTSREWEITMGKSKIFPSNAFMASARSFNTLYGIAKAVISN